LEIEGVEFGHGQHIGFGHFITPVKAGVRTALSKIIKKMTNENFHSSQPIRVFHELSVCLLKTSG
jgi:hypothetical protein